MRRSTLLQRIVQLVGPAVRLVDRRDGWPGILEVEGLSTGHRVAAHVAPVGGGGRPGREAKERRFQNPGKGKPLQAPKNTLPSLLGLWDSEEEDSQPVLVGMEVNEDRLTKQTRQSYFVPLQTLLEAQAFGWAEHTSASAEEIFAFHPPLLPVYLEARLAEISNLGREMASIAQASGLVKQDRAQTPSERARYAAEVLVRNASFSKLVIEAYDGLCAMCGLNFGLLEGAHILPVAFPGSPDEIWNGLALCRNHHGALDRHRIWIDPNSRQLKWHPEILEQADRSMACAAFLENTAQSLQPPKDKAHIPRSEMLIRRYELYDGAYDWAD